MATNELLQREIAENLNRLISGSNLTGSKICEITGIISPAFLSQLRRQRRPLNVFNAHAIARALGISVETIHPTFKVQTELLDTAGLESLNQIVAAIDLRLKDELERSGEDRLKAPEKNSDVFGYSRAVFEAAPGSFFIKSPCNYRDINQGDYLLLRACAMASSSGIYLLKIQNEYFLRKIAVKSDFSLSVQGDTADDQTNLPRDSADKIFTICGQVVEQITRQRLDN